MIHVKIDVKNHISRCDFVKICDFHKIPHSWAENFQSLKFSFFFQNSGFWVCWGIPLGKWQVLNKKKKKDKNQDLNVHWIWKSVSHCFPGNYFQGSIENTRINCMFYRRERYKMNPCLLSKIVHSFFLVIYHVF